MLKDNNMHINISTEALISPYINESHVDSELFARTVPLKRTPGIYHIPTVGIIDIEEESDDDFENEIILSSDIISN